MRNYDSTARHCRKLLLLLLIAVLCGCVHAGSANHSTDLALVHPLEDDTRQSVVDHFQALCLRKPLFPEEAANLAEGWGWRAASDEILAGAGLAGLRKQILAIPGGGARFDEEQVLLARAGKAGVAEPSEQGLVHIAAIERRIAGSSTRSTTCAVYSHSDFLKTCEQIGRHVNRAPDRNQFYRERDAHFIQWNTRLDGLAAVLSCSRTPQSQLFPFEGTILSVHVDHTGTARKSAFNTPAVRSSLPVFVE